MKFVLLCVALTLGACVRIAGAAEPSWLRPDAVPVPEDNALTAERIELGKTLFFDPRLSGSNWISCASCHNPALGWSDGLPTGLGHGMQPLGRHTPTILNTAYNPLQMWDGRFKTLEQQALGPMGSPAEMNQDMNSVVQELSAVSGYRARFEAAYPGEGISLVTVAKAIASFERTVVSGASPFDRWQRGEASAVSESAKHGFELFKTKAECALCHMGWNFTDNGFHNIGLSGDDAGRYAQKPLKSMKGAFKTPTLRDIALTAPYMHNGQYRSLEQVIDHYDRGGDAKDNLSPNVRPLHLSADEKRDLLEFLKTLTAEPMLVSVPQLPQ